MHPHKTQQVDLRHANIDIRDLKEAVAQRDDEIARQSANIENLLEQVSVASHARPHAHARAHAPPARTHART